MYKVIKYLYINLKYIHHMTRARDICFTSRDLSVTFLIATKWYVPIVRVFLLPVGTNI